MALTKGQKITLGILSATGIGIAVFLWWRNKKDSKQLIASSPAPTEKDSSQPFIAKPSEIHDVLAFQKWYNLKGFKPHLVEDNIAGVMTTPAYAKYGSQFLVETTKK